MIKIFGCLPENVGFIPLVVVIMTTTNEMHPVFSGRHTKFFDHFRYFPMFTDFSRRLPKTHLDTLHSGKV